MCNSGCKTCSIWRNKQRCELSPEKIEDVVRAFPVADYVFGGGEAILHTRIVDIFSILNYYSVNYTLLSNCIMLDKLKEYCIMYGIKNVTISYDGTAHDSIRGSKGNSKKIWNFVEWAKRAGINVKLSYTYSAFNEQLFESDMEEIKSHGIERIYFCLAQDMELLGAGESVRAKDFGKLHKYYDMIDTKDQQFITSMINNDRLSCDSQSQVHTVYSNGDIVRCQSYLSEQVLGNINNMDEAQIRDLFSNIKNEKCPYNDKCNLLCQRRYDDYEKVRI
jgi:radical SAM protein with 4Fe4S-binding SPASM domain